MNTKKMLPMVGALLLVAAQASAQVSSIELRRGVGVTGIPAGGQFVPAGTLYDNEQSDGTTSLASQNSTATFTARSADDFTLDGNACPSGQFDISLIRAQLVQQDAAPQAFAIDIFADDGSGTQPTAGINPIATLAQAAQTNLGAFGAGTSIFEASFDTTGLQLDADTTYWISAHGADAAANAAGFNNFFAVSAGAVGTTDNGVIIAPDAGVAVWTATDVVVAPPRHAYAFAIDGTCAVAAPLGPAIPVPASNNWALLLTSLMLGLIGVVVARRVIA